MSSTAGPSATSAGTPIAAARIATCDVGPPAARQMPASLLASSETSCEGFRSSAIRIARSGSVAHADRRFAVQRQQHLRFQIEQVVDALGHARIAERAQRIGAVAHGATPREAGTLAARDRATRRGDQLPVVEEFEMRGDHFARRRLRMLRELLQPRAHLGARPLELRAFVRDAAARFGDLQSRRARSGTARPTARPRLAITPRSAVGRMRRAAGLRARRAGLRRRERCGCRRFVIQRSDQTLQLARAPSPRQLPTRPASTHRRAATPSDISATALRRVRAAAVRGRSAISAADALGEVRNQRGGPRVNAVLVPNDHAFADTSCAGASRCAYAAPLAGCSSSSAIADLDGPIRIARSRSRSARRW